MFGKMHSYYCIHEPGDRCICCSPRCPNCEEESNDEDEAEDEESRS